ncbi:MAG: flavin reductase family protein [Janthinobacterium lividum]
MHYIAENIPRDVNGKIWAALISPRPLALISTQDTNGVPNIAPYNSYSGLATYPPMLGVSFSQRAGEDKHTLANIKATQVFVINLVPRYLADIMNQSAEGTTVEDDFARLDLTAIKTETVNGLRIGECPASIECRVTSIFPLPPSKCELVAAQIVGVYLRDEFVTESGGFDPMAADLLSSVGAEDYLSLNGESLHLPKTWG